jgi:dipeptidyl aminopeptidase/acylaminoacyl peptidase
MQLGSNLRSVAMPLMLAGALLITPATSAAAQPVRPSIDALFKANDFGQMVPSPSGRYMALLAPRNGRHNLVVIDLVSRKPLPAVTDLKDEDVREVSWVNDNRLVFSLWDLAAGNSEQQDWGGLIAINVDGSESRVVIPPYRLQEAKGVVAASQRSLLTTLRDGSDDVLVQATAGKGGSEVYRVSTKTGAQKLLTYDNPGKVENWLADNNGVVRIAIATDTKQADPLQTVYYRESADKPWRPLKTFSSFKGESFDPLGFDRDNKTLFVSARQDGDHAAVYAFDVDKEILSEPLVAHAFVDVDQGNEVALIRDRTNKVIGISVNAEKPETYWFDQKWAEIQAAVDGVLPDRANTLAGDVASQVVITSEADVDPGQYYLLDTQKMHLEKIASAKAEIEKFTLSRMEPVRYPARDGRIIPAYLTLPAGKEAKNLPLVVNVHGGPYGVRDRWGWHPEVQFLASRGYAVLQANYRGSGGFGLKHFKAGWKQWGLSMQDDLTDGVNWLVTQGKVDPKRVCIVGGSYGGYATAMGLVKDPDLYQCGVDAAGVSDILLKYSVAWSDYAESDYARYGQMHDMIGDPVKDRQQLEETSPLLHADRMKAPIFIAHGGIDRRVPLVHAEKLRDRLKSLGKTYEWLVIPEEGHGFFKLENQRKYYGQMESFLAKYIGN